MNVNQDDPRYEDDLIEALAALEAGDDAEAILRRFPASAAALRPALDVAARLAAAAAAPTAAQSNASLARLLSAFDARAAAGTVGTAAGRAATPTPSTPASSAPASTIGAHDGPTIASAPSRPRLTIDRSAAARPGERSLSRAPRSAWAMAAGIAALFVFSELAYAATRALPGDAMYAAKEAGRGAWLAASFSPAAHRARVEAVSAARRADVAAAMAAGRTADVLFEGVIEAYASEWCQIGGLKVNVPPDVAAYGASEHAGAFGVGDRVRILAHLVAGRLVATSMVPFSVDGTVPPPAAHVDGAAPNAPGNLDVATVGAGTVTAGPSTPTPTPTSAASGAAAAATSAPRATDAGARGVAGRSTPDADVTESAGGDDGSGHDAGDDHGGGGSGDGSGDDRGGGSGADDGSGDDHGGGDGGSGGASGGDDGGDDHGGDEGADKGGEKGGDDGGGSGGGGDDGGGGSGGDDRGGDRGGKGGGGDKP